MKERIARTTLYSLQPALVQHLVGLGEAAATVLEAELIHLVKIRVSQINGCGFCQHMHAAEARKDGERQERLDVLPAWREMPCFSPRERAALAWSEALTLVAQGGVSDALYADTLAHFSTAELANLTAAVVTINGWNRVAVGFGFIPAFSE